MMPSARPGYIAALLTAALLPTTPLAARTLDAITELEQVGCVMKDGRIIKDKRPRT